MEHLHTNRLMVGITGASGSGKTFLLNKILSHLDPDKVCTISLDNYYLPRDQQPVDSNKVLNFDTLQSMDLQQYAQDLLALKNGETVYRPEYTFNNPNKKPAILTFKPAPLIISEGIFVFSTPELRQTFDLKIFVDAPEAICLKRRIIRDNHERGYDMEDVLYRYEKHVMPAYRQHIKPFKDDADLIVPNNRKFALALSILVQYFRGFIDNKVVSLEN